MANKSNTNHWAQKKERGSLFGIYFMSYVFKILGATACKVIMTPVLFYFYLFNSSARMHLKQYLSLVQKQQGVQLTASQWNTFKIIANFGYGIIDKLSAWSGRLTLDNLNAVNDADFRRYEKQEKGAILLVSHLGNFEICRVASEQRSPSQFNVFMHTKNSQKISKVIESMNSNYAISIIQGDELTLPMVMNLKDKVDAGEFIVIAGDRVPVKNSKGTVEVDFLGQPAKFPIGPFVLAKVLSCPIISLYCLKNKNKYDVYFDLLLEQINFTRKNRKKIIQEAVEKYAVNLEIYVKKAPLQWYNFHQFWTNKNDK